MSLHAGSTRYTSMVNAELLKNVVTAGVVDGRGQFGVGVIVMVALGEAVRVAVDVLLGVTAGVVVFGEMGTDVKVEVEAGVATSGVSEDRPARIQPTGSMDPFVGRGRDSNVGAEICLRYALTGPRNGSGRFSPICSCAARVMGFFGSIPNPPVASIVAVSATTKRRTDERLPARLGVRVD